MVYKIGIIIIFVCLVKRITGGHWPYWVDLQPSMELIEEKEEIKDSQVMVPSLLEGLDIPLEMLWSVVLKNPSVTDLGVSQPETIISPTEEIFNKYFREYISDNLPSNKSSNDLRMHLLLDHLAHEFMPYSTMMEALKQDDHSDSIQFLNLNGKALNFTLDDDEMLLINGNKVTEVRSREADKGPIVYVIAGILFNHLDIVKPDQKNVNGTRMDGISYLEPSF